MRKKGQDVDEDVFDRTNYTQSERDTMDASDFAGPHESFPIKTQEDVDNAARLIGHAANPDAVKAKIKAIAKRKGLSIPKAWQEEDGSSGSEERMTKQADSAEHIPDEATTLPEDFMLYVPFTRVSSDDERREIVGIATKEVLDNHGTIISYEASKKAFARWQGNIREQHDAKKAVGKAIDWTPDDENKQIFVRAYISKGAQDTWEKIKEGVLTGFSIAGVNAKYKTIQRDSKSIPYVAEYDMPELSIVDNPSCPVGPVALVRADGATDVLASDEEIERAVPPVEQEAPHEETPPTEIERKSVAISAANRDKLHSTRDSITQMCADAGCPDCQGMLNDSDDGGGDTDQHVIDRVAGVVEHAMAPVYQRMNAFLGQFSRAQNDTTATNTSIKELSTALERVAGTVATLLPASSLDEVRSELIEVKGQIERFAKTPLPGGPHTGRQASGKHLATDGSASPSEELPDVLRQITKAGVTLTPAQQALLVAGSLKPLS